MPTGTPVGTAVVDIERPLGLLGMMELSTALANGLADPDRRGQMSERTARQTVFLDMSKMRRPQTSDILSNNYEYASCEFDRLSG